MKLTAALLGALVAVAVVAVPASAAELVSTNVSTADAGKWRRCHERQATGEAVVQRRVRIDDSGLVWATLDGPDAADWDLALFDAKTGRLVAGSAGARSSELAEGFSQGGRDLIAQACLVDGSAGSADMKVGYVDTRTAIDGPVQLVRVKTPTHEDKTRLQQTGLDLTEHGGPGFVEVVLYGARDAARLTAAGFTYDVRIGDLVERAAANRAADRRFAAANTRSGFPSGGTEYRRLPDYEADLKELALQNPALVKLITLPHKTLEGRDVLGIEITTDVNADDGKPVFLQAGLHHAREWPSGEHAIEWAYELVNGYNGGDARTKSLVEQVRTIVVPVVNVDGFNLSREAPIDLRALGDLHPLGYTAALVGDPDFAYKRRNCRVEDGRAPEEGECGDRGNRGLGVDPNRNYGALWGGPGASTDPGSDIYRGAGPFSEPETQNIRELVSQHQVTTLITNHTFSNLVLRPPGVRAQGPPPDDAVFGDLGARMAAQNGYANIRGYELYDTTGTTEDWSYAATGGLGFTFEIGPDEFHPPFEEAVAEYEGTRGFEGKGNRGAYFIAMENAADASRHSVIEGSAQPGSVIRLHKQFMTSTHNPLFLVDEPSDPPQDGELGDPILFEDTLDTTMVVPDSGRFELHANPSTRPGVAANTYRELAAEPSRVEEFSTAGPTVPGGGASGPPYSVEHEFVVNPGDPTAGLEASIEAGENDDFDIYLYRELEDGSRQAVLSAASATGNETLIAENVTPGTYVLEVRNWLAGDPTYTGRFALYEAGETVVKTGTTEAWTLTCERPGGEVVNTEKVTVDRGGRVSLEGLCAQPSGPAAAQGAPAAGAPRGSRGSRGSRGRSRALGRLSFRLGRRAVTMTRGGRLRFRVACPRSDRGACVGVLSAYVKRVKLGRRAFSVRAGRTAVVSVKVSRKRQRYLKRLRSARATLVATTLDGSGRQVHRRARFRLRAR